MEFGRNYRSCNRFPEVLKSIPFSLVRKASDHCFRFMDDYCFGLSDPILDYAIKKYKSHGRLNNDLVKKVKELYAQHHPQVILLHF